MKKVKKILLVLTILAMLPLGVFAKEKVNVYLFKREGCGYCAKALTFFTTLSSDEEYKNYFNLVVKEVSNKENSSLMEKTAKKLGVTINGVPFIVIGEQHFEGYANTFDDQIKQAIKTAYETESKDIVVSLNEDSKNSSATTIIILLAVLSGIAFLIYMAKENKEEIVEEIKEEKIPKEEVVSKSKTIAKKTTDNKTKTKSAANKKATSSTTKKKTNKK